jgi:hypothetical protein
MLRVAHTMRSSRPHDEQHMYSPGGMFGRAGRGGFGALASLMAWRRDRETSEDPLTRSYHRRPEPHILGATYTRAVAFPCPTCGAAVTSSPEWRLLRCASCGAWLRARPLVDGGGSARRYRVYGLRPRTAPREVELTWDGTAAATLGGWLAWATLLTLALVVLLAAVVWLAR